MNCGERIKTNRHSDCFYRNRLCVLYDCFHSSDHLKWSDEFFCNFFLVFYFFCFLGETPSFYDFCFVELWANIGVGVGYGKERIFKLFKN